VLPRMRYGQLTPDHNCPTPGVLEWNTGELNVVHWHDEPWIRLRDMPCLLPGRRDIQAGYLGSPWERFKHRYLSLFLSTGQP
jgi:hypothetical protein